MILRDFQWGWADLLLLLWTVPAVLVIFAWSIPARMRKLALFGYDPIKSAPWLRSLRARRWMRAVLLSISLAFLALATAQPRGNPDKTRYKTTSRDIAVVLDVSKSMLADDIKPNRLERSKLELEDLCEAVKAKGSGDRLGLIVFAGNAVVKCPLTSNYSYFKRVLRTIDAHSASQGGTRIGDAVRKALSELLGARPDAPAEDEAAKPGETVITEERKAKREAFADILIVTDGEDMDSFPLKAAQAAREADIGIYAVGLGSEQGSPILIRGANGQVEPLKDRSGEVHLSKLDSKTLQDMINSAPRGSYYAVGTLNFDLADFFQKTIALEAGREVEDEQVSYTEIFQPFLLAGFVFYVFFLALNERPRQGQLAQLEPATGGTSS